jgi:hypothetical protein
MAETRSRPGIASAPLLTFGSLSGCLDIAGFEKFYQQWVFESFGRHLPGLPWSEKQSFPAGQEKSQRLASLVGDVHGRFSSDREGLNVLSCHKLAKAYERLELIAIKQSI